ncbi:hypothetical protein Tco_0053393 [Tanacetum coccineum]
MDNPNITMEEYIRLEEEKARRCGQDFNWETATYGKVSYFDDVNYFKDFKAEFPAIVFNDTLISKPEVPPEPTVSTSHTKDVNFDFVISYDESDDEDYTFTYDKNLLSYKLVPVSNSKSDSNNYDDEIDVETPLEDVPINSSDEDININVNTDSNEFNNSAVANRDTPNKSFTSHDMAPLPPRAQRHPWLIYEVEGYTDKIVHDFEDRLGGARHNMTWRQFILALGLHTVEEMAGDGFEAYWASSLREIAGKGDLSGYWSKIAFDGDFLEAVPSYTTIRDPIKRLCHRLITCSISSRGQAPEKVTATDLFYLRSMDEGIAVNIPYFLAQYLFRHAEGKERRARMLGGQFVGLLAEHFRLVTKEGLQGLTVVVGELRVIDTDKLGDPNVVEEGALAVLAPMQPPPGPRAASPTPQTMP